MGKKRLDPLKTVTFHCKACGHKFEAEPDQVLSAPDLEHHPFEYLHECPDCGAVAEQIAYEKNLLKAHANATGPKTEKGKKNSAKNLEGHPTPEEAQLTRFNAIKHGLYARTAGFFPARPGSYDQCEYCEYLESRQCLDPPRACLKKHELMLRNHIAFETKDPGMLIQIQADNQAWLQAMLNDIYLAISQDGGPRIREMVWHGDKDGGITFVKYRDALGIEHQLEEIKAHPLLKVAMDIISKNHMTLADMGMTVKVQEENEQVKGFLNREADNEDEAKEYRDRVLEGQRQLQQMIKNSYALHDPLTIDAEVVHDE